MQDEAMSIFEHLQALRRALIYSIISIIPGAVVGWIIRKEILRILIKPVYDLHYQLVYIGATEAFTAELLIAVFAGVAIALPYIAYQFWKFVLPALHAHERRYIVIFVPFSIILFVVGVIFGYFTVFTYGVRFLLGFGMEGITPTLSLGRYLSFTIWFLLPFGIMFELPLVLLLLIRMGLVSREFLASKRKVVAVGSFIVSAVATPTTDMFSQTVMAVAIYVLFESSIWISYFIKPSKRPVPVEEAIDDSSTEAAIEPSDEGSGDSTKAVDENLKDAYDKIVERGTQGDK